MFVETPRQCPTPVEYHRKSSSWTWAGLYCVAQPTNACRPFLFPTRHAHQVWILWGNYPRMAAHGPIERTHAPAASGQLSGAKDHARNAKIWSRLNRVIRGTQAECRHAH